MSPTASVPPYAAVRVLELGSGTACAYAGQLLADRGADVIKVEPPAGDPSRARRPHRPGESKHHQWLNRSKRSVIVDDATTAGRDVLVRLARDVDVLLTDWTHARLSAAGIDSETALTANPRLVFCHDRKFGDRGEWADRPANDLVLQAFSGLIASEGKHEADGAPAPLCSTEITQFPAGVLLSMAIGAALLHREVSGVGQRVAVNELGVALAIQSGRVGTNAAERESRGEEQQRLAHLRAEGAGWLALQPPAPPDNPVVQAGRVMYRGFVTADGAVFLGALSRNLRQKVRRALGTDFQHRDGAAFDPEDPATIERSRLFVDEVQLRFAEQTTAHWRALFEAHGVPCGEVSFAEDLGTSEQARVNGYVVMLTHPADGEQLQVAPPALFGCNPTPSLRPAPALGEHTDEIYDELGNL